MALLVYKYSARDSATGKKMTSEVQAESEMAAAKVITAMGLSPIDIHLKDQTTLKKLGLSSGKISTKVKILFTRQLATLINAGLPILQSLRMVMGQSSDANMRSVSSQLIGDIESGVNFSDSLKKHPKVFSPIFVSLIEAGEASGTLDASLERIAFQQEKDAELSSKVQGALVYPIIVLIVMAAVVTFMLTSVLPQVEQLYKGLKGVKLPFLTQTLISMSNIMVKYWWALIVVLGVSVFLLSSFLKTSQGKNFMALAKMKVPIFGTLFKKLYMARFARTGATLIASGVPIIKALEITANAVDNLYVSRSIHKAIEKVKSGKSLSESLEGDPYFLDLVPSMLKIGEQSGQIESMFTKTAVYYEKEVDDQVKGVSTVIEPLLMISLGGVAIVIVAAVLLPIYSLVGKNAF
jgi:type IV pilus assembly protein PilC